MTKKSLSKTYRAAVLAAGAILIPATTTWADLLAGWNFNDAPTSGAADAESFDVDHGAGTLSLTAADPTRLIHFAGTTVNAVAGDVAGPSLVLQNGEGAINNGSFFDFTLSTTNYEAPVLSYATQRTSTGFTSHAWAYSTDGVNFTPFTTLTTIPTSFGTQLVDFSSVAALSNLATIHLRLTLDGGSTSSATGNNRLDNIQFNADVIGGPEPRDLVWDGNAATAPNPSNESGSWEAAGNWYDGVANVDWDSTRPDNATFGIGGGATGTTTVTVGAPQNVGSITFAAESPAFTVTGSQLVLEGDGGAGITANQSARIDSTLSVTLPQTWNVADGATLDIGDGTAGGLTTGGGSITKTGGGLLALNTPASGFGGSVTIDGGTVKVNSVDTAGNGGAGSGISGVGTGVVTVNSGASFHIDNVRVGFRNDGTTPGTGLTVVVNDGATLIGSGANAGIQGTVRLGNNAPNGVTISVPNAGDHFVTGNAIRNVSNVGNGVASSTVLTVTGDGHFHVASGGTSLGSDQFSGSWNIAMGATGITAFGPILNGGFGEILNAPGYITPGGSGAAYNGETRPITLTSGTLAFGADQPNMRPAQFPAAISFRSPLTLNGGSIASTGLTYSPNPGDPVGAPVAANLHGSITVAGAANVLLYDPVLGPGGGSRDLNIMSDPNAINPDATPVPNNFSWGAAGSLSTVGAAGTPGRLKFARTGGTVTVEPGAVLTVGNNTVVELAGSTDALSDGVYHVNVVNDGALEVTAGTKNVGDVGGSGSVTVNGSAQLNATHVRGSALTVNDDAIVQIRNSDGAGPGVSNVGAPSSAAVSHVDSLGIGIAARLDLTNNKLLTNAPVGTYNGTVYTGVQGQVQRAYNFGGWDLPGLMTSEPLAGPNAGPLSGTTTIGVATAEQVLFIAPTDTAVVFGQTVTGATTIAMYTYAGDMNFDGLVDAADYGVIDNWVQFPGTDGYANGDLNYDGVIDAADYGIIDNTIQLQGAPFPGVNDAFASAAGAGAGPAGVTAVPEPASLGVLAIAAAGLLARRRRAK